jgi:hypothetical protein
VLSVLLFHGALARLRPPVIVTGHADDRDAVRSLAAGDERVLGGRGEERAFEVDAWVRAVDAAEVRGEVREPLLGWPLGVGVQLLPGGPVVLKQAVGQLLELSQGEVQACP